MSKDSGPARDVGAITRREARILARPARVSPPSEITDEMRELAAAPPGYGVPGELPEIYAVMLHTPELLRLYQPMGAYFLNEGALSPRDRELAILRIGWLCQAPYEWGEHVTIGKAAGLTSEEIERVSDGASASGWTEHEAALLKAVEELFDQAFISETTWETLAKTLDERQLVELPLLVGQYQGVAYFLNSLRIPLRPGNPGLRAS